MQLRIPKSTFYPIAMLLAGCSSTDGPLPEDEPSALRMEFTAKEISGSRALTTAGNITDNPFAVWGSYVNTENPGAHQAVFDATEVAFSTENNAWGYADTQYWLPGFTYSFAALHPAGAEGAKATFEKGAMTLDYTISTDAEKRVDLLHAVAEKECGDYTADPTDPKLVPGPVAMQFAHILCQVHFLVRVDPAVRGNVTVTSAKLWGIDRRAVYKAEDNTGVYSWMSVDTDQRKTSTETDPYVTLNSSLTISSGSSSHLFHVGESPLLIIPQQVNNGATLEVIYSLDGVVHTVRADLFSAATHHNGRWLKGQSLAYTLTVGADDYIIFERPVISEWEMSEGGNYIIQDTSNN